MVRAFHRVVECCVVAGCAGRTDNAPGRVLVPSWRPRWHTAPNQGPDHLCRHNFQLEDSVVQNGPMKDPKASSDRISGTPQLSGPETRPWTPEEDWLAERGMPSLKRVYPPHAEKRRPQGAIRNETMEAALSLCLLAQQEVPPQLPPLPKSPQKLDKAVQCKPQKCNKAVQCNLEKRGRTGGVDSPINGSAGEASVSLEERSCEGVCDLEVCPADGESDVEKSPSDLSRKCDPKDSPRNTLGKRPHEDEHIHRGKRSCHGERTVHNTPVVGENNLQETPSSTNTTLDSGLASKSTVSKRGPARRSTRVVHRVNYVSQS